jgi:4'-phosphopantetheinyl transferase
MPNVRNWRLPSFQWSIAGDEVHVWRASLSVLDADQFAALQQTLTEDEAERASHFLFQGDRERFVVARGILRTLLGRYLGRDPRTLRFAYGAHGKPFLGDAPDQPSLTFNLSHAGEVALFAVACRRELGVDIEYVRDDINCEQISEAFFSPHEQATLRALPRAQQVQAFFDAWTRKEAYIKARGKGLTLALNDFDVSLVPGQSALLLNTRDDPKQAERWTLQQLWPYPGYAATLAAEGSGWQLVCLQWPQVQPHGTVVRRAR